MPDTFAQLRFPVAGIALDRAFSDQKPAAIPMDQWRTTGEQTTVPGVGVMPTPDEDSVYGRTCAYSQNCRAFEATAERRRGGSRPGLARVIDSPVVAGWVIQALATVVNVTEDAVRR